MPGIVYEVQDLPLYLPVYYKHLFPFKPFFKWLCYGKKPSEYFIRREFAFILENDVYLRYRSYPDQSELEKSVQKDIPHKIDIGAVFNYCPKDRSRPGFEAQERELIFDIDLTDYDDIRTCCSGGSMCRKCWKFMVVAIKVLDAAFEEDFGFKHRLWLFSGRRGVHCWVADLTARKLTPQGRSAVADYLNVVTGGEKMSKKVQLNRLHPSIERAYDIIVGNKSGCDDLFGQLIQDQGWLDDKEAWDKIVALIPEPEVRGYVEKDLKASKTPAERWKMLKNRFDPSKSAKPSAVEKTKPSGKSRLALHEIVLQYAYPRLDINVTKGLNHLLKSPFCVHPKTGKISIPLNTKLISKFDFDTVPRVDQLLGEMGAVRDDTEMQQDTGNRKILEYKRTSLAPFVDTFEQFVESLCKGT